MQIHHDGRMFTCQHWNEGLGAGYDRLKKLPDWTPQRKVPRGPPAARDCQLPPGPGTSGVGPSGRAHLRACALALVRFQLKDCSSAGLSEELAASDAQNLPALTGHKGAKVT